LHRGGAGLATEHQFAEELTRAQRVEFDHAPAIAGHHRA
jgi:hypothetical protein